MKDAKVIYNSSDDDDDADPLNLNKGIYLFGKDVTEIKCFRNSFICGICCGFGGGLLTFLVTSKSLLSTHFAFASLWLGVFGYWFPCRVRYENSVLLHEKLNRKKDFEKNYKNQFENHT